MHVSVTPGPGDGRSPGNSSIKLLFITDKEATQDRVFVHGKPFQPVIKFTPKNRGME